MGVRQLVGFETFRLDKEALGQPRNFGTTYDIPLTSQSFNHKSYQNPVNIESIIAMHLII